MEAACYEGRYLLIVPAHGLQGILHHGAVTGLGYVVEAGCLGDFREYEVEVSGGGCGCESMRDSTFVKQL